MTASRIPVLVPSLRPREYRKFAALMLARAADVLNDELRIIRRIFLK